VEKPVRIRISILLGSFLTMVVFFVLVFSSIYLTILFILLAISYVSIITFLILWSIKFSKLFYILLIIPAMCLLSAIIINKYDAYIQTIPVVDEHDDVYYSYNSFGKEHLLATLSEKSSYSINENVPVLDGATAFYPLYAAFANAVYPIKNSSVLCSKTENAYINLLEGEADIIFCLAPSEEQLELFQKKQKKLSLIPIGKEAFVFFVNKRNEISNLTVNQIQGIYAGEIKNWNELGGKNKRILSFQRPKNSGSQTALEGIMENIPIIDSRKEDIQIGMSHMIKAVAIYRNFNNAIGYSFLYFTTEMVKDNQIKLLKINGIYPTKETSRNGTYPFLNNFYAIYIDNDNINENIKPFIEWILSEQGQELVEKTGYIPVQ
jgi:phosphate transport system substrate-binding protein